MGEELDNLGRARAEWPHSTTGDAQKIRIARRLRVETAVMLKWIAQEMHPCCTRKVNQAMVEKEYLSFRNAIRRQPVDAMQNDQWVLKITELYLASSAEDREKLRSMFCDEEAQWYLLETVDRLCAIPWQQDQISRLRLCLGVLSMQDRRIDPRDFVTRAERVYLQSRKEGLDPDLCFREIAAISSTDRTFFLQSTAELFQSVANRLRGSAPDTAANAPDVP